MKLNQLIKIFDLTAKQYGLGLFVYQQEMSLEARRAIFNLTDYKVSSSGAGSYFLIPIN